MLRKVYGRNCMHYSTAHDWYLQFEQGREDISNARRKPRTSHTSENVKKVLEILQSDSYVSTNVIAGLTGLHEKTVAKILKRLGKRRVCERFVPNTLTEDQKDARMEHCRDMIRAAASDSNFMKNIVTCGRIWISEYDEPLPEQQTASTSECQSKEKTKPKRMFLQKSKTLLIVFFDSRGMVYNEFIPEGQTMDAVYYLGILDRLWDSISRDRSQYEQS
ncbi:uncharacterized protein LOC112461297, partial [Temnothorax curvispinosus]|uniref:Uncharacterized protein LOC112461297 n=1 Tax=Temnothorax curvispinosus TaxID=300111 RepID=A0A6J1QML4_9HYME